MNTTAIIPARGGSKGIERKNLVKIEGKPLIAYSIEHALKSKIIDNVIVSTDDEEIAEVAKEYGAEVPFFRPKALAEDHILDLPVFEHAIDFITQKKNHYPNIIVHLRPTAPIRKPEWIDEAISLLQNSPDADSVRSVSEPSEHPYRMFTIDSKGYLDPIMKHEHARPYLLRRQDHPQIFHYNCVIDVTRIETIREKKSMTGDKILPYIMDPATVFDIDTKRDLEVVRCLASKIL